MLFFTRAAFMKIRQCCKNIYDTHREKPIFVNHLKIVNLPRDSNLHLYFLEQSRKICCLKIKCMKTLKPTLIIQDLYVSMSTVPVSVSGTMAGVNQMLRNKTSSRRWCYEVMMMLGGWWLQVIMINISIQI